MFSEPFSIPPSPSWGGLTMTGKDSHLVLPSRIASQSVLELGIVISEGEFVQAFKENLPALSFKVPSGLLKKVPNSRATFYPLSDGLKLSITLLPEWKFEFSVTRYGQLSSLNTFNFDGHNWVSQDLPSGAPAETVISSPCNYGDCGQSDFSYVFRERNFFQGEQWNSRRNISADRAYYDHGGPRWAFNYVAGEPKSESDRPWCSFFWEDGSPMMREYGCYRRGLHRPASEGPAYEEFYRGGKSAQQVYAEYGRAIEIPTPHLHLLLSSKEKESRGKIHALTNVSDPFTVIKKIHDNHEKKERMGKSLPRPIEGRQLRPHITFTSLSGKSA